MIKKLIHCPACNQVIPNYQGYELSRAQDLAGVEWSDADFAGAREFLRAHFGHKLEELTVEEGSWVSEKPAQEPLRVSYCLARKAGQELLLRRTKSALDRPACYEIVQGRMNISPISLKIQENELRRQIAAEEGFSPSLKGNAEKFIRVFRDEIARIPPEKIEEETEGGYPGESVTFSHAGLNNARWEKILGRCRLYFDKSDLDILRGFIAENRNPPDVLSIQIERRISILPLAGKISLAGGQSPEETEGGMEIPSFAISKKRS